MTVLHISYQNTKDLNFSMRLSKVLMSIDSPSNGYCFLAKQFYHQRSSILNSFSTNSGEEAKTWVYGLRLP